MVPYILVRASSRSDYTDQRIDRTELQLWEISSTRIVFIVCPVRRVLCVFFFFQAEDGIRDLTVTGVQTCALPISALAQQPRGACASCASGPSGWKKNPRVLFAHV